MPKIDAPTVVEHHARQRAAIIAAARSALGTGGVSAVTPGAVASAAGLARTSIYQYFPSGEALLTAAIEDVFAEASDRITQTLQEQPDPWGRVRAYVTVALHAAAGDYGPFHGITAAELPPVTRARMWELRDGLTAPLIEAIEQIGAPSPQTTAALAAGVISSGITLIRHGASASETVAACCAMVAGGLHATRALAESTRALGDAVQPGVTAPEP